MDFKNFHQNFCNFTVAGADTYADLTDKFMLKYNDGKWFDHSNLIDFHQNHVNRFLMSFGAQVNYKTRKLSPKHDKNFLRVINMINDYPHMKNTVNVWDSGGFQISMGAIQQKDIDRFLHMYYETVANNSHLYNHFFILDVPPGPGSKDIFKSYGEIEEFNRRSYNMCKEIVPEKIRQEKCIYIHHFRTPSLFRIWNKLLFDDRLSDDYQYFGTGGLVANMSTGLSIPIVLYTIPLLSIVKYAKERGLKEIAYHVLGGAGFLDAFYHKLFEKHVYEYHGIKLHITYDSSGIFKGVCVGRFIHTPDEHNNLVKLNLRSNHLHLRFNNNETIEDKIYNMLNTATNPYGFRHLTKENTSIYDKESNTFSRHVMMYLFQYLFYIYKTMETRFEKTIDELIYPAYKSGDIHDFDKHCRDLTISINQGKPTKLQSAKCSSLYNSLKMIETLDMDHSQYIVDKFLSADEINVVQSSSSSVLTF